MIRSLMPTLLVSWVQLHLPSLTYLQPVFPILLILTVIGLLFRSGRRLLRPGFWGLCGVALLLLSWPPMARLQLRILEGKYQAQPPSSDGIQAMVVLASEVLPATAVRKTAIPAFDTYQRCQYAAWLHRRWREQGVNLPVVVSGKGSVLGPTYADTMKVVLSEMGVPSDLIWTEGKSRSTHENAVYVAEMLRGKGISKIALVTEAYHMPRSEMTFRKEGLTVVPAACGFRTDPDDLATWVPATQAIDWNQDALHEFLGILWYRIRGRI